jgi:hypothetical protein
MLNVPKLPGNNETNSPSHAVLFPGTGIAEPGDLLFFITHHSDKQAIYRNRPRTLRALLTRPLMPYLRRSWINRSISRGFLNFWQQRNNIPLGSICEGDEGEARDQSERE